MSEKSGEIKLPQAANYLNRLGNQSISGRVGNFLTGVFEASHFNNWRNNSHFSGVMFWFCYGKINGRGPEIIYLAAEPKFDFVYPTADPVIARGLSPYQEDILIPLEVKGKILNGSNGMSILQDLDGVPSGTTSFEKRLSILRKVYRFLSEEDFWELNKYGHGYFEAKNRANDYFENLLGPVNDSPEYLRYYLGFDEGEVPAKLRIFLMPVDRLGNNIQTLRNPRAATLSTDPYLLQFSWPPPPKQY